MKEIIDQITWLDGIDGWWQLKALLDSKLFDVTRGNSVWCVNKIKKYLRFKCIWRHSLLCRPILISLQNGIGERDTISILPRNAWRYIFMVYYAGERPQTVWERWTDLCGYSPILPNWRIFFLTCTWNECMVNSLSIRFVGFLGKLSARKQTLFED